MPPELEDELPAVLQPWPVLGCEVGEASDGELPVTLYLRASDGAERPDMMAALAAFGMGSFEWAEVEAQDWLAGYRRRIAAFAVGSRWWLDPHPEAPSPAPSGRWRLVMPPRTAFGSGSHESTQLVLSALEKIDLAGATVLDVGTGSGILAFAAERSGAAAVLAVDVDPQAIRVAREIADQQEWPPGVHFVVGSAACAAPASWRVVLCNMISERLLPLLDDMTAALAGPGILVLSGIMASERARFEAELNRRSLTVRSCDTLSDWSAFTAERRS
jgi:ribosomal protein L11 methyltransferase